MRLFKVQVLVLAAMGALLLQGTLASAEDLFSKEQMESLRKDIESGNKEKAAADLFLQIAPMYYKAQLEKRLISKQAGPYGMGMLPGSGFCGGIVDKKEDKAIRPNPAPKSGERKLDSLDLYSYQNQLAHIEEELSSIHANLSDLKVRQEAYKKSIAAAQSSLKNDSSLDVNDRRELAKHIEEYERRLQFVPVDQREARERKNELESARDEILKSISPEQNMNGPSKGFSVMSPEAWEKAKTAGFSCAEGQQRVSRPSYSATEFACLNSAGYLMKSAYSNDSGDLFGALVFTRNGNDLTRVETIGESGKVLGVSSYEGKKVKSSNYDVDGNVLSSCEASGVDASVKGSSPQKAKGKGTVN